MTKEEARLTLQENFGYLSDEHPRIIEAMKVAMNILSQPSIPSNLDEAAEKYSENILANNEDLQDAIEDAFKDGAEWLSGQGVTKEAVIGMATGKIIVSVSEQTLDELNLCPGDKVVVQIRKKQ